MNKQLANFYLPPVIHHWVDDERFPQTAHIRDFNRDDEDRQYEGMAESMKTISEQCSITSLKQLSALLPQLNSFLKVQEVRARPIYIGLYAATIDQGCIGTVKIMR